MGDFIKGYVFGYIFFPIAIVVLIIYNFNDIVNYILNLLKANMWYIISGVVVLIVLFLLIPSSKPKVEEDVDTTKEAEKQAKIRELEAKLEELKNS